MHPTRIFKSPDELLNAWDIVVKKNKHFTGFELSTYTMPVTKESLKRYKDKLLNNGSR